MSTPAIDIKRLISNLGRFHPQMVAEKILPKQRLQKLPGGEECIDIELTAGIELWFSQDKLRFESLLILLREQGMGKVDGYKGPLPSPYEQALTQDQVRSQFGQPLSSSGPVDIPGFDISVGAFDMYQVDSTLHPTAMVDLQYDDQYRVAAMVFSVLGQH
jgi:hypothetical protein